MPISYAKRTSCQVCRVPSMRYRRRLHGACGLRACYACLKARACCAKAAAQKEPVQGPAQCACGQRLPVVLDLPMKQEHVCSCCRAFVARDGAWVENGTAHNPFV